jgi:hypothetical protein
MSGSYISSPLWRVHGDNGRALLYFNKHAMTVTKEIFRKKEMGILTGNVNLVFRLRGC